MKFHQLLVIGLSAGMLFACKKDGCTDPSAVNYNEDADNDDGSCYYDEQGPGSGGPGGANLPINLTGTEDSDVTIKDQSTNPSVVDYYLDGTWTIKGGVTIEPGVRIEMRPGARIVVGSNGFLDATGLVNNRIEIFGAQDVAGYWYNIAFESNNPNNKLIYCNISNGSSRYNSQPGMIVVSTNSEVIIQNSNISKGSDFGLMTKSGNSRLPDFHSNSFSSFEKAPIRLASLAHADYLDNSTVISSNNNVPYINIYGIDVYSNTTVPKMSVPYLIMSDITFGEFHTKVEKGVEMVMRANVKMEVKSNASLEFAGTSTERCKVKGEFSTKGYWYNIMLESNNPNNKFSYTDISDGTNRYNSQPGFIWLAGASLKMNNCFISNASTVAVDGNGGNNFEDNGGNDWSDCDGGGGYLP